tara:strand:+ start:8268 stop:10550 length:2283 start_codon:yes stop_codon:yes gene_type:complete
MGFLVSPGVEINEIDLTNVIPAVSTSIGGIVGSFRWGEAEELTTVGTENELAAVFGKPDASTFEDYYNAAQFLQYGNNLKVYRTVGSAARNAVTSSVGGVGSVTVTNAGSGYISIPTVTFSLSGGTTNPTLAITLEVEDFDFTSGSGSNYTVGDIVKVDLATTSAGGADTTQTEAQFRVDAVTGGTVTALSMVNVGAYTRLRQGTGDSPGYNSPGDADFGGAARNSLGGGIQIDRLADETLTTASNVSVANAGATGLVITDITMQVASIAVSAAGDHTSGTIALQAPGATSDSPQALSETATATVNFSSSAIIKNETDFDSQKDALASGLGSFVARYAGALGNEIDVVVVTNQSHTGSAGTTNYNADALFDGAPGTDGSSVDQIHIAVIDRTGNITGTVKSVLEKYQFVSVTSGDKQDDGTSNFYIDIINDKSNWIYANPQSVVNSTAGSPTEISLSGGVDSYANKATKATAYTTAFKDTKDTVDVNLIIGGAYTSSQCNTIIAAAENRKDAMAFVSPELDDTANVTSSTTQTSNVEEWASTINSSSYGFLDSGSLYIYDKYNDVYRYISAAGTMAGLCANTDSVADAWFSPAGFNRGGLRGVTKLAYNPNQTQRDTLYRKRINPIVSFPGQGIVLFGDKTALSKSSAFNRINVRRLFITLEKAIATAAKFQLFEFNDEFTRAQFRNLVEPFLRDVKGRRGLTDFLVVCDETNNTSEVIDGNRFVADIYVKPNRSINFISLNFIATRSGVEFSEIVGTGN